MINVEELKKEFVNINGGTPNDIHVFFAPGRVNLIGEHTDYNDGFVMPFSLQYGTCMLVRQTTDTILKFKSSNFPMNAQVCLQKEILPIGDSWINYPLGVVKEFIKKGFKLGGMEMLFSGDIPNEAGLSSSASIEMVTAYAINELFNCQQDKLELVKMGQRAENEFVGMNCGIMDQFAVTMGEVNHAVFLDCKTLDFELVPFILANYVIVICNTNKKRGLAGSKYNERRTECEKAVEYLSKGKKIKSLRGLDLIEFEKISFLIEDPVIRQRARHVISENDRVLKAKTYLNDGKLSEFGNLMKQSHVSLRDDYEVSCQELDVMVDLADKQEGVLGSRMTGAGFGGCSISLVPKNNIEVFIESVGQEYLSKTGIEGSFYVALPENGVCELN